VVTHDVKAYALVVGVPARQVGWMSRHGERLAVPLAAPVGAPVRVSCPASGERYRLVGDRLEFEGAA
jgi:UDP-2-acetamido-3-amino-2,3-dideoxy-glucuronate N-acetyltransferase